MTAAPRFLTLIPARAGSKRVPGKNKRDFCGKPLIAWTIEAAISAGLSQEVVVSTDDHDIAAISQQYGAQVPFMRPDDLCTDTSLTSDCVMHALHHYAKQHIEFDYIILLQPTSPLRTARHLQQAVALLDQKQADSVVSVCEADHSPQWCKTLPNDLSMNHFAVDTSMTTRSQDLEKYFRPNGAIYIIKTAAFRKAKSFYINDRAYAYVMDREDSVDIDTEMDFVIAAAVFDLRSSDKD